MTDIICPLCGKANPPEREECKYCGAPLKVSGFIPSPEGTEVPGEAPFPAGETPGEEEKQERPRPTGPLEQAIPDWLKETEASFLEGSKAKPEETASDQGLDDVSEQIEALINQPSTAPAEERPAIDDEWLAGLLAEAGAVEPASETTQGKIPEEEQARAEEEPTEVTKRESFEEKRPSPPETPSKPDWLADLEASTTIKLEGGMEASMPGVIATGPAGPPEKEAPAEAVIPEWVSKREDMQLSKIEPEDKIPDWVSKPEKAPPTSNEVEEKPSRRRKKREEAEPGPSGEDVPAAPAEIPSWLEALRPPEEAAPSGPVEDLRGADMVTAGPLAGLRGVISAHPSAMRARKPPSYSIKLRVTDEQRARMEMMEQLLAEEGQPKPLSSSPMLTSRNIFRIVIAALLLVPIFWMIIAGSRQTQSPQSGNFPGVVDFTQQLQKIPTGKPVLLGFDYEAAFSGELNTAVSAVVKQLINKRVFITLVATNTSGPALAESLIKNNSSSQAGDTGSYSYYTDLGFIPGGTLGLRGLATSPKDVLPYSLDGTDIWSFEPMNTIATIKDFGAVIVMTSDSDTVRAWIEQVGPQLKASGTPLLIVTSAQAEPLIRPYYEAMPPQVQGLIAGLGAGVAYAQSIGNLQSNGMWDAFSIGISVSILIILVGSIISLILMMLAPGNKKGT